MYIRYGSGFGLLAQPALRVVGLARDAWHIPLCLARARCRSRASAAL